MDFMTIEIPVSTVECIKAKGEEMQAIYADKNRSDWFEADDLVREIAEWILNYL